MAPNSGSSHSEFSYQSRQRSWDFLKRNQDTLHNVLIVGGGIVGAGLLRQLLHSGVKDAVLIEKGDFASGTSGASSKLIHAGIRYLEQAWIHLKKFHLKDAWRNFVFVVQASYERKVLGRMAPVLIKPKIIYLILAHDDHRSWLSVLAGIWFYYILQLIQGQFFSPPQFFKTRGAIRRRFPDLEASQVKAIFGFWDSETDDARLVIENLQSANDQGALIFNYVELINFEKGEDRVRAKLKDCESGDVINLEARLLINAAGPWIDDVRAREDKRTTKGVLVDRVAGGHMDVYPSITNDSFYITAKDGRLVFVLRRDEDGLLYSRIGTTERTMSSSEPSDGIKPTSDEINYLKTLVRKYFPQAALDHENILHLDEGIRPLTFQEGENATQKSREHAVLVEDRVVNVIGVKLTDFRRAAADVVQTLSWDKFGISLDRIQAVNNSLRPADSIRIYLEKSLDEIVRQTMVLHGDDYVERRRGRWLRWMEKVQPERWVGEIRDLGRIMGWSEEKIQEEMGRVEKFN